MEPDPIRQSLSIPGVIAVPLPAERSTRPCPSRVAARWRLYGLLLVLLTGCGSGSSPESFRPNENLARESLEAALTAWKSGQAKPAPITNRDPPVHIVDKVWESKAKLKSFEIESAAETPTTKTFTVKLQLEKDLAPRSVLYVVVGKSPVWVFREEDYKTGGGM